MKQNSLILPLVGGGLALFCFFLPWLRIDLSTLDTKSTFPQITGSNIPQPKLEGIATFTGWKVATDGADISTISLLAAIAIIAICIYTMVQKTDWKYRVFLLICSGIGLLSVLYIVFSAMKIISLGVFGAGIGFIVALIGAWNIPESEPTIEAVEDNE